MNTNCLEKTLKGTVDNDNLLKIGEMLISHVGTPTANTRFNVQINMASAYINVKNGKVYDKSSGQEITSPYRLGPNTPYNFSFDGYGSEFTIGKYDIERIVDNTGICYLNVDDLKYSPKLTYLDINSNYCFGNVKSLENLPLTYLQINGDGLIGDISSIGKLTSLTRLQLTRSNISGNINTLRNLTSLNQNCSFAYNDLLIGDVSEFGYWTGMTGRSIVIIGTNITGTIESFAQKLVANSAADGTYTIVSSGANVTYNGVKVNYSAIVTISGSNYSISVS